MRHKEQYSKHNKRSHRSHKESLVGMQLSKTARPDSIGIRRLNRMLFSGKYRLY